MSPMNGNNPSTAPASPTAFTDVANGGAAVAEEARNAVVKVQQQIQNDISQAVSDAEKSILPQFATASSDIGKFADTAVSQINAAEQAVVAALQAMAAATQNPQFLEQATAVSKAIADSVKSIEDVVTSNQSSLSDAEASVKQALDSVKQAAQGTSGPSKTS